MHHERAAKNVGRTIDWNKTKLKELIDSDVTPRQKEGPTFEKVGEFEYIGEILSTKNDWSKEIDNRMNKAEKIFYVPLKFSTTPKRSQEDPKRDCMRQL